MTLILLLTVWKTRVNKDYRWWMFECFGFMWLEKGGAWRWNNLSCANKSLFKFDLRPIWNLFGREYSFSPFFFSYFVSNILSLKKINYKLSVTLFLKWRFHSSILGNLFIVVIIYSCVRFSISLALKCIHMRINKG